MSFTKGALGDFTNVVDRVSKTLRQITDSPGLKRTGVKAPQQPIPSLQSQPLQPFVSQLMTQRPGSQFGDSLQSNRMLLGGHPLARNQSNLFQLSSSFLNGPTVNDIFAKQQAKEHPFTDSSGADLPSGGDPSGARGLDGTKQYQGIIQSAANESGVPWQVIAAIMGLESGGQNLSPNGAGAVGVMQIVPKYWQGLANQYGGDLSNPETNIRTAAAILKQNYDRYGSWEQAAAAYFGAIDAQGNVTGATDLFGTSGYDYVSIFKNNLAALGYGNPSSAEAAAGGKAATGWADGAVQAAMSMQGTPYIFGGEEPGGFDCSGLMQWAYAQMGKQLPRTAQEQYQATQRITSDQLQPGDLIFFTGTADDGRVVTHVGMYIGNGQMIQAPKEGDIVKVTSLNSDYWQSHLYGFGRVV